MVLTLFILYNPFIRRSENNDQNVLTRELFFYKSVQGLPTTIARLKRQIERNIARDCNQLDGSDIKFISCIYKISIDMLKCSTFRNLTFKKSYYNAFMFNSYFLLRLCHDYALIHELRMNTGSKILGNVC